MAIHYTNCYWGETVEFHFHEDDKTLFIEVKNGSKKNSTYIDASQVQEFLAFLQGNKPGILKLELPNPTEVLNWSLYIDAYKDSLVSFRIRYSNGANEILCGWNRFENTQLINWLVQNLTGESKQVRIDYTNWLGETNSRIITPISVRFGSNQWHPEPQWLLSAVNLEDQITKEFAIKDIHTWTPVLK